MSRNAVLFNSLKTHASAHEYAWKPNQTRTNQTKLNQIKYFPWATFTFWVVVATYFFFTHSRVYFFSANIWSSLSQWFDSVLWLEFGENFISFEIEDQKKKPNFIYS